MIETLPPAQRPDWDAFVASRPGATCYQWSGWSDVARRVYRLSAPMLVARDRPGGALRGALPLFVVPRPLHRYVTTGLFGAYGPVLADDAEVEAALLAEARRFTDAAGAEYLHVKALGDGGPRPGFARHDVWVRAVLPLDGGADAVWGRFKSSIRAAVRQAERAGLELREGPAELAGFYDVLAENMHRKGTPIFGMAFMRALLDAFADRAEVVTLWRDGRAVSGALTLRAGATVCVPFASSRASSFHLRPNQLLYWRIIERACAAGLAELDFGSSMRDTSTLAFKHHFGARVEPVPSYVYSPSGRPQDLTPNSAAVQAGVRLMRALPRRLTDALGPEVCRLMA